MCTTAMQHSPGVSARGAARTAGLLLLLGWLAPPALARAQADPYSDHARTVYAGMKAVLLRTAGMAPEEVYAYRPTAEVRTFGQILGHAADSQYYFCSAVLGEPYTSRNVAQTKSSKAELTAALREAFAYCDRAYDGMTDAAGAQVVKVFNGDSPRLGALVTNSLHLGEHYGNLVTYLRLNGMVPPTSDPAFMAELMKKPVAGR